jgi:predicted peroxiredoxin
MSQVNIIVAANDSARLYAAVEAALAWAALGREVQIFLQGEAVAALRRPIIHPGDRARQAAGQPDLAGLLGELREMGVQLFVCQTGLELAALTMEMLAVDAKATGLVGFLAAVATGAVVVSY